MKIVYDMTLVDGDTFLTCNTPCYYEGCKVGSLVCKECKYHVSDSYPLGTYGLPYGIVDCSLYD